MKNARAYFESIKIQKRSVFNMPDAVGEPHPVWDGFDYRQLSRGNQAVITPLHLKDVYIKTGHKRAVKYGFLNYMMMYRDTSDNIITEWITLQPSAKWLDATHSRKYDGVIIVRDRNGKVKRILRYTDGQPVPKATIRRSVLGAAEEECTVLVNYKIKNKPATTCGCEPNHTYNQIGQCSCNVKPTAGGTIVEMEAIVDCPEPENPGGAQGSNGNVGDSPEGNGSEGGGSTSPSDYAPESCNSDPDYTMPATPPPPGQEWAIPCSELQIPVENIDEDEDPTPRTNAQIIADAFTNNNYPLSETAVQWLEENPEKAELLYQFIIREEDPNLLTIAYFGINNITSGEMAWMEFENWFMGAPEGSDGEYETC